MSNPEFTFPQDEADSILTNDMSSSSKSVPGWILDAQNSPSKSSTPKPKSRGKQTARSSMKMRTMAKVCQVYNENWTVGSSISDPWINCAHADCQSRSHASCRGLFGEEGRFLDQEERNRLPAFLCAEHNPKMLNKPKKRRKALNNNSFYMCL